MSGAHRIQAVSLIQKADSEGFIKLYERMTSFQRIRKQISYLMPKRTNLNSFHNSKTSSSNSSF